MRYSTEDRFGFGFLVLCVTAVVIVLICHVNENSRQFWKTEERIKLAKIAAATSQYCNCLQLMEAE